MSDREYNKVRFEYDIWINDGPSPYNGRVRIRTGSTYSWIWTGIPHFDDRGFFSIGVNVLPIHPYLGQHGGFQTNCTLPRKTWIKVHDIIDVGNHVHIWKIIIGSSVYSYTFPYVGDYVSFTMSNGDDHRTNYQGSMLFKVKDIKCYAIFNDDSEDLVFEHTFPGTSIDYNIWSRSNIRPHSYTIPNISDNTIIFDPESKIGLTLKQSILVYGKAYLTTYGPLKYKNERYLFCFSGKSPINYPTFPYTNMNDLLDNCEPYNAEGNISIPDYINSVNLYMVGGGGSGGIHCVESLYAGAGGGGSGYYKEYLNVPVINKTINIHTGGGGTRKWRERGVLNGNYKGNDGYETYVIIDGVKYNALGGIGGGTGTFGCGGNGNIGGCAPSCDCVPVLPSTTIPVISTCIGLNQSDYKSSIFYWDIHKANGAAYGRLDEGGNKLYDIACGCYLTDGKTDKVKIVSYVTNPQPNTHFSHNITFCWDGTGDVWIDTPDEVMLHSGYIRIVINNLDGYSVNQWCVIGEISKIIPSRNHPKRIYITDIIRSDTDATWIRQHGTTPINFITFSQHYYDHVITSPLYLHSSLHSIYNVHMDGSYNITDIKNNHPLIESYDMDLIHKPGPIESTFGRNGIGEGGSGIVGWNINDTKYNFMGSRGGSGCVIIELNNEDSKPTASFDIYPDHIIQDDLVQFINESILYDNCMWTLHDGTTTTDTHVSKIYNTPGEYTIKLLVYGTSVFGEPKTDQLQKSFTVNINEVHADFTYQCENDDYTVPCNISFINTSYGGIEPFNYEWHYRVNNGKWVLLSTSRDVNNYTFKVSGKYDIKLIIYNDWTYDTIIKEELFEVTETIASCNFTSNFINLADNPAPLTVTFYPVTNGYIDTYEWEFGDGTTLTVHKNRNDPDIPVYHVYDPGEIDITQYYTVKLTVYNTKYSDYITKLNYIYVTPLLPIPKFIVNEPARGISPHMVTFNNISKYAESYRWDFGDDEVSYDEFPSHVYTKMGEYNVSLTAYNYGKSRTPLYKRAITYTINKAVIVTGEQMNVLISPN